MSPAMQLVSDQIHRADDQLTLVSAALVNLGRGMDSGSMVADGEMLQLIKRLAFAVGDLKLAVVALAAEVES